MKAVKKRKDKKTHTLSPASLKVESTQLSFGGRLSLGQPHGGSHQVSVTLLSHSIKEYLNYLYAFECHKHYVYYFILEA